MYRNYYNTRYANIYSTFLLFKSCFKFIFTEKFIVLCLLVLQMKHYSVMFKLFFLFEVLINVFYLCRVAIHQLLDQADMEFAV